MNYLEHHRVQPRMKELWFEAFRREDLASQCIGIIECERQQPLLLMRRQAEAEIAAKLVEQAFQIHGSEFQMATDEVLSQSE